ncbi:MAG: C40 family peptidase [Actinomycetaceae bacterium]|nr:C40 family peptidase [Actinomycetaceae bacterium]
MKKSSYQARHRRACRPQTPLTDLASNISPAKGLAAASVTGLALGVITPAVAQAGEELSLDVTAKTLNSNALTEIASPKLATNPAVVAPSDLKWEAMDETAVEAEEAPAVEEVDLAGRGEDADRGYDRASFGPAPASTAGGVVGIAAQYIGVPYVWGGTSPAGFDCSGLVQYVYAQVGIHLPRTADAQGYSGTPVSAEDARPGDIVFYPYGHVGIYVGNGQMIHASQPGQPVAQVPIYGSGWYFVRV